MSEKFKNFCEQRGIKHIMCPSGDHRGNGKVERLIRTINERIRAEPQIVKNEKEQKLFSELISALRTNKNSKGKSPFEKHWGRKPNTTNSVLVKLMKQSNNKIKGCLDETVELNLKDIPRDTDSDIWVREKLRRGKLGKLFQKKRGRVLAETDHTVQFAPKGENKIKVLSKRNVAKAEETTPVNKKRSRKQATPRKIQIEVSNKAANDEQSGQQSQIVNDAPAVIDFDQWEEDENTEVKQQPKTEKKESGIDDKRAEEETGEQKSPELRRSTRNRKATVKYGEAVRIFNIGKIH